MGELWFVGLGLGDELLPNELAHELHAAGELFLEEYTSVLAPGRAERLERSLGRPIRRLGRAELEAADPVREALGRSPRVVLFVGGDPFVATTHVALRVEVERWGHTWRYFPGATVLSAVPSLLGLQHYRFGRTVSLPFPEPNFSPTSPLELLRRNRAMDSHTLVLLDLRPEEHRYLRAGEALRLLRERDLGEPKLLPDGKAVGVVARVGRADAEAWYGPVETLLDVDFGPPPHSLVVPAPVLHFEEEAALTRFLFPRGSTTVR